jgi:hypothetical protein
MNMKKSKRLFFLSILYIILGVLFIFLNHGDLKKSVSRHPVYEDCLPIIITDIPDQAAQIPEHCFDTKDLRYVIKYTYPDWWFFSDNNGYDQAYYLPIDLAAAFLIGTSIYIFTYRPKSK